MSAASSSISRNVRAWLGNADAHALAPGGVVIDLAVLDRVLEDHRE